MDFNLRDMSRLFNMSPLFTLSEPAAQFNVMDGTGCSPTSRGIYLSAQAVGYRPYGLVQLLALLDILWHNELDFLLVVFSVFRISEIGLTVSGAGFGTQKDAFNNHIRNDKITEIFRSLVKQSG